MSKAATRLRKVETVSTVTNVPFIDLKRALQGRHERIVSEWERVLTETEFVGGKRVALFEKKLGEKLNAQNVLACANGTDALILALQSCGVGPGSKVAVPNLTFWATYEAVVQLGATPVLIDMNTADLQMDFDEFKKAFDQYGFKTALIAHLYGWASPRLSEFRAYCRARGIILVEDGAQSFGVTYKGKSVYEEARIATLSFYPAKVLGGAMDGGAIVGSDPALIDACRVLANHGRSSHYSYSRVGWNSRMGGLQAAFLLEMLDAADDMIASRNRALDFYNKFFSQEIRSGKIRIWMPPHECEGNGYLAVMTVKNRSGEDLQKKLTAEGVGCGRTYPETVADQPCVSKQVAGVSDFPRSKAFVKNVINLPLFAYITAEECEFAAQALRKVIQAGEREP